MSSLFLIKSDERAFYLRKIQSNPDFRGAYIRSLTMSLYINQIQPRSLRFTICRETYVTMPVVIYTSKNFYLLDKFNEKIELFKSAGLIDHWNFQMIDKKFLTTSEINFPKTLVLSQLWGCFELLLFGYLLDFIALILEIIRFKVLKNLNK